MQIHMLTELNTRAFLIFLWELHVESKEASQRRTSNSWATKVEISSSTEVNPDKCFKGLLIVSSYLFSLFSKGRESQFQWLL